MLGRTFAVLPSWQFLRPKTTISNFVWNFEKILNFFIAFKKIIKIGPTCFKDHSALKLKKHRNFATFKFFSLRCEIELVPQNINKLHWNKWIFFYSEAIKLIVFFFDCSFLHSILFCENWQYCKMGWKNLIFQISTIYLIRLEILYKKIIKTGHKKKLTCEEI